MPTKCPLCGQELPAAIDALVLHQKLDKMNAVAAQVAVKAATKDLEEKFESRLAAARKLAQESAERGFRVKLLDLETKLGEAEKNTAKQVEKARKAAKAETVRLMKDQVSQLTKRLQNAEKKTQTEVAKAKKEASETAKETERLKHAGELIRLRSEVEKLNRQLEKKSGEQFGEEGEVDLFGELLREFPTDKIERVGRGIKGADIVHTVMDGTRTAGRIVYECKNVQTWQNAFIEQAKKYNTQYETPYVMVVSRVFPKKQRGMCVHCEVPVVEPRLAAALAAVMREGILEIAKLRLTRVGANEKALELFGYVVSNEFQTRFRNLGDGVDDLKVLQKSERNWHENQWAKQADIHARIEGRHREINARLQLIVKEGTGRKPLAVAVGIR